MPAASAPSPSNYSNLVDVAVLPDYAEYRWEMTKRKRALMDMLTQNGSIKAAEGGGGKYLDWLATVGEFALNDHADLGQRTFDRVNTDVNYVAPYAFLETTDAISENDWGFLQTKQARNAAAKDRTAKIVEDQAKKLNRKMLQQNCENSSNSVFGLTAYAGSQRFFGLPTLFGYGTTGLAYNPAITTVATAAASSTSKEIIPNTTYCGISTHPVNSLSGVPDSMRVQEATSPVICNWSATNWTTGSFTTFQGNCLALFDHMITRINRDGSNDYMPDLGLMTQTMYNAAKVAIRGSTQQHVVLSGEPTSPDVGMYKRFFFNYNGVMMTYDIDQPTDVFYLLNTKKIKFRYLDAVVAGFTDGGPYTTGKKRFMTLRAFPDSNVGAFKFISKLGAQMICQPDAQAAAYTFA